MNAKFKTKKVKSGIKKGEKETYMATIVLGPTLEYKEMCEIIADRCSLTETDVAGVVLAIVHQLERNMKLGNSVHVGELGIFSPSITSKQVNHPDELRAEDVEMNKMNYRSSVRIKEAMKKVTFER